MVAQNLSIKSRISQPNQKVMKLMDARALLNKKKGTVKGPLSLMSVKSGLAKNLMTVKVDARHKLMKKMDVRQKINQAANKDARQKLSKPADVVDARQKLNKIKKVQAVAKNLSPQKRISVANGKASVNGKAVKTSFNSGTLKRTVSEIKSGMDQGMKRKPVVSGNRSQSFVAKRRRPMRPIGLVSSGQSQNFPARIDDSATRMFYNMSSNFPTYNMQPLMDVAPRMPSIMDVAPLDEMHRESLRLQTRLRLLQEEEERAQIHQLYKKELEETRALRQSINDLEGRRMQREREMMEEEIVYRPPQNTIRSEVYKPSYNNNVSSSIGQNTLIVSNLIPVVHESELESCFEQFGRITCIDFISNDSAKISFERDEDASLAEKYLDNKSVPQVFGNVYSGTKYSNQRIKVRIEHGGRNDIKSYFSGKPAAKRQSYEGSSGPLRFQSNPNMKSSYGGRSVERITPDIQATHSALFSNSRSPFFGGGRGQPNRNMGRMNMRRY